MEFYQEIEKALAVGRYRKTIWRPFMAANREYDLVREGDRIAVCISGGKDSMLLAKCMQQLQRRSPLHFELKFICMDPGYAPENRRRIEENCALLHIPVEFFETDVFAAVDSMDCSPCYMCAKMRRGYLYRRAQALGCNKIALGHHLNDVIETALMSMSYGAQLQGMVPRLRSTNFEGMELIRPLYCIREDDIIAWQNYNGLRFLRCACRVSEAGEVDEGASKRKETKELIRRMRMVNPNVEINLFASLHKVNLDTLPGYKTDGEMHSFLERLER